MSVVLERERDRCILFDEGVSVGIFRAPLQGERVIRVREAYERAAALWPERLLCVAAYRLSPDFPIGVDADSNLQELAKLLRTIDRSIAAHAAVIEFGGVRGAAMRIAIRAVRAFAGSRSELREFGSLAEASTWLRGFAKHGVPARDPALYLRLYREAERHLAELDAVAAGAR